MDIKDFTVGQTAYVYDDYYQRNNPACGYREVVVAKIGRTYVSDAWGSKYRVGYGGGNYLEEKVDAGSPRYLFRTKQDLDDFIEAKELMRDLRVVFDWNNIKKLSLDQLRAIKRIIEG